MWLAILARSIWSCLSPDTQIPFPRPATVFFYKSHYISLLSQRDPPTMMSNHSERRLYISPKKQKTNRIPWVSPCSFGPVANSCKLTIWRRQLSMTTTSPMKRPHDWSEVSMCCFCLEWGETDAWNKETREGRSSVRKYIRQNC